jgi:hypothetical protein
VSSGADLIMEPIHHLAAVGESRPGDVGTFVDPCLDSSLWILIE